jgi:acyl-coenzyme A synthetase/AMP-(fatty) acid ligase
MILGNILRRNSKLYPNNESLIYEEYRFTWAETQKRVNSLVNGLLSLGIQKGDRIAVLSDNSHRYLEIYLASAHAGFIIVPLNAMFKPLELIELLKNADVSVLFCGKNYLETKDTLRRELPDINYIIGLENHDCLYDYEQLIADNSSKDIVADISPDDIFVIAYTSGTTGNPKGAVLTHGSCYMAALIHSLEWRVSQADNYLFPGRLFFAAGGPKFIPFVRGCKTVVTNFEPHKTLELIEREKISFFSTGPTIISLLTNQPDI